jgi:hypothetical protein
LVGLIGGHFLVLVVRTCGRRDVYVCPICLDLTVTAQRTLHSTADGPTLMCTREARIGYSIPSTLCNLWATRSTCPSRGGVAFTSRPCSKASEPPTGPSPLSLGSLLATSPHASPSPSLPALPALPSQPTPRLAPPWAPPWARLIAEGCLRRLAHESLCCWPFLMPRAYLLVPRTHLLDTNVECDENSASAPPPDHECRRAVWFPTWTVPRYWGPLTWCAGVRGTR